MNFSNLTKRLLGRVTNTNDSSEQNDKEETVVFVADASNNWNKFVLLVSIEGEKLPSVRSNSFSACKTFQKPLTCHFPSLTTAQWNELALGTRVHSVAEEQTTVQSN